MTPNKKQISTPQQPSLPKKWLHFAIVGGVFVVALAAGLYFTNGARNLKTQVVPNCTTNLDCNDHNGCTADVCMNAGDAAAYCLNEGVVCGNGDCVPQDEFTYLCTNNPVDSGSPEVKSLSPVEGPVGTGVTITGSNFTATNNYVQFSGEGFGPFDSDGTTIKFEIPKEYSEGPNCYPWMTTCPLRPTKISVPVVDGDYSVEVVTEFGVSKSMTFTVTSTAAVPTLTSLEPKIGVIDKTSIMASGTNFRDPSYIHFVGQNVKVEGYLIPTSGIIDSTTVIFTVPSQVQNRLPCWPNEFCTDVMPLLTNVVDGFYKVSIVTINGESNALSFWIGDYGVYCAEQGGTCVDRPPTSLCPVDPYDYTLDCLDPDLSGHSCMKPCGTNGNTNAVYGVQCAAQGGSCIDRPAPGYCPVDASNPNLDCDPNSLGKVCYGPCIVNANTNSGTSPGQSSLLPTSGPVTTHVVVTGSDFTPTNNFVKFGGAVLGGFHSNGTTIEFDIPTEIQIGGYCYPWMTICPSGAITEPMPVEEGPYDVQVVTQWGLSNTMTFIVTKSYIPQNVVATADPHSKNIFVRWDPINSVRLEKYNVYRINPDLACFTTPCDQYELIGSTFGSVVFLDTNTTSGKTYSYKISSILDGVETPQSVKSNDVMAGVDGAGTINSEYLILPFNALEPVLLNVSGINVKADLIQWWTSDDKLVTIAPDETDKTNALITTGTKAEGGIAFVSAGNPDGAPEDYATMVVVVWPRGDTDGNFLVNSYDQNNVAYNWHQ